MMSRPSRPRGKPKKKTTRKMSRVRSGAEVWAKFGARHDAILAAMEAAHLQKGAPSWDAQRERGLADGTIALHEDGSESHGISPELAALFRLREEMFEFKFGRPMRNDDVYFFDVDADTPQPEPDDLEEMIAEVRAAAQKVGVDPDRAVEHFLGHGELTAYQRRRQ
jgi:hypothetical protein